MLNNAPEELEEELKDMESVFVSSYLFISFQGKHKDSVGSICEESEYQGDDSYVQ